MQDLLQQASTALSRHDADSLERLTVEARACRTDVTEQNMAKAQCLLEVLRRQVLAASSHLALRQRLSDTASARSQSWAR